MSNKALILSILNILKSLIAILEIVIFQALIDEFSLLKIYYLIILSIVLIFFIFAESFLKKTFYLNLEVKYKSELLETVLKKDTSQFKSLKGSDLSNLYLSDIKCILDGELEQIPALVSNITKIVLAIVILIKVNLNLIFVVISFYILLALVIIPAFKKIKNNSKDRLEEENKINTFIVDICNNYKGIKVFSSEKVINETFKDKLNKNKEIKNKNLNLTLSINTILNILIQIFYLVSLIYTLLLVKDNTISLGVLVSSMLLISYLVNPLLKSLTLLNKLTDYKNSKDRITEINKLEDEKEKLEIKNFKEININKLTFSYNEHNIFKDFTFKINSKDKILIKGCSSIGKTTLFNLLLGFIKGNEGNIQIKDNKNKEYDIKEYRNNFAFVSQENLLFDATVKENFNYFNQEFNKDSLKLACIDDLDMDTLISHLSIGQRQRLSLAIALSANKEILLLDEFTSAVNKELEEKILKNVLALDKTILIISNDDIKDLKVLDLEKI